MTMTGIWICAALTHPIEGIAGVFRLRGGLGYEPGRDALRQWLRRGGEPARFMSVAAYLPRAKGPVLQALEMLT